ncbi:SGNH hydrolase domain-containing protein [Prosthecomicrobium pneumaticum]|uniref:SGNH hydrolase domain-containing protein n=1 Tax=Prosthecomicrobium pneumaticum TaxID=81895 RepID=UPI003CCE481B
MSLYIQRSFVAGEPDTHARTRAEWLDLNRNLYGALSGLHSGIKVLDLADYFCDAVVCFAICDGQALYFDDDHMSVFGARRVAGALARLLE